MPIQKVDLTQEIMKRHILTALREEFDHWEELIIPMSETQVSTPLSPSHWSVKDIVVHLWAWLARSIARIEAVLHNREPANLAA